MVFSFYYVEKIANTTLYNNELFKKISDEAPNYNELMVNAEMDNENIIPGIAGKNVNVIDSYYNMKSLNAFNSYYLIYQKKKPSVSLEKNKDKVVKKGNRLKNSVSFIIDNDIVKKYFEQEKIMGDVIVNYKTFNNNSFLEQINGDNDNFKRLNNLLDKNDLNKNICFIEVLKKDVCLKNKMYLIDKTYYLNKTNLVDVKKVIEAGDIIYIKSDANLSDVKILIGQIKFRNYKIVSLSDLIKE